MNIRIRKLILVAVAILTFAGCRDDEPKHQTSHPDKGGIALTVDWSTIGTTAPKAYQARIISSSGHTENFDDLSGTTNTLLVEPGQAMMYVYNTTNNITVSGKKATVSGVGAGIAADPGWFFTWSGDVQTERDRDITRKAKMTQQTGELKLSLAIKPAEMASKVTTVNAVLEGVASELDMQTNSLSGASSAAIAFAKGAYYATTSMRLLGVVPPAKQNLKLEIGFEGGGTATATSDLSPLMSGFNSSKNTPLTLAADMNLSGEGTRTVTIGQWEQRTENRYLSVSHTELTFPYAAFNGSVTVATDQSAWDYSIIQTGNWLTVTKTGTGLDISASEHTGKDARQAIIHISAGGLTEAMTVTQGAFDGLEVTPGSFHFGMSSGTGFLDVRTYRQWSVSVAQHTGNWCTAVKDGSRIKIDVLENRSGQRQATVRVTAGELQQEVIVTQDAYDGNDYFDKEVVKLQSATVGKGINIVMMGDGYTSKDMRKGTGKYERDMRTATDHFFSVYPYTVYRNHFNVYMVAAVSNQEGISIKSSDTNIDTKFGAIWEGGGSTGIDCDEKIVVEYVDAIDDLMSVHLDDITVVMPINANIYAGTCKMYPPSSRSAYGSGFSICMSPVDQEFRETVVHESGGHGFAKLIDEYYRGYHPNETILDSYKSYIIDRKESYSWFENVDFYSDITLTSWSGFAGLPKYSMVATFEGAYRYGYGIWRPEYNSCMNNNVFYFNAPSRWAQVKRIKKLAGFSYTFAQFLQEDVVPEYPAKIRANYVEKNFVPLAPPIIKEKAPERFKNR